MCQGPELGSSHAQDSEMRRGARPRGCAVWPRERKMREMEKIEWEEEETCVWLST